MQNFAGTPGTIIGLLLRVGQCVFAAGSIVSMASSTDFFNVTAFCYLIASMALQVIWSGGLALLDGFSLAKKKVLHNHFLVTVFAVGDWVTATLSLSAASSSAGITVLYYGDLGGCRFGDECTKFQLAAALGFMSWIMIALSSLIMFWIWAAG